MHLIHALHTSISCRIAQGLDRVGDECRIAQGLDRVGDEC